MIPISDENPTLRTPWMTYLLLAAILASWFFVQGAGFDQVRLMASVCNLGMVPGELTGLSPVGTTLPLGPGLACVVDAEPVNWLTPITSMFLHGDWGHLISNLLFFWVFANNVEDSMGRLRFLFFYLICGLAAAAVHIFMQPDSPIPTVGASGAISGVLGAYLVLYPRVRVNMLFFFIIIIRVIPLPAWLVLIYWFTVQLIMGLPDLFVTRTEHTGGVAVWAHIGGFLAGLALIKVLENRRLVARRTVIRHQLHPDHP